MAYPSSQKIMVQWKRGGTLSPPIWSFPFIWGWCSTEPSIQRFKFSELWDWEDTPHAILTSLVCEVFFEKCKQEHVFQKDLSEVSIKKLRSLGGCLLTFDKGDSIFFHEKASKWWFQIGTTPHPVAVTTRIITFLIGNPYKPSFVTVTGWGVDLSFKYVLFSSLFGEMIQFDLRIFFKWVVETTN